MVLAAGAGRRLHPLTDDLPKTLLPVNGEWTILDVVLDNFRRVGLEEAVVIVGFAEHRVRELHPTLEERHGLSLTLVSNDRALEWNNAYSLWCAREHFGRGVLLSNGDTVHPASVEESVLEGRGNHDLVIALDDVKTMGDEEMKVQLTEDGLLAGINKALDPAASAGEYIGITYIEAAAAAGLADALEATFRRDPQLYYEDGFQEYADRGGRVGAAPIGEVDWVEVDDHADLARAREVACLY
jgi:choline kinase